MGTKRWLLGAMLLSLVLTTVPAQAETVPRGGTLEFEVLRDGKPLGHHRLTFTAPGEGRLEVAIEIRLKVDLAFLTVYRYEHDSRERWADGRLVGLRTRTDDDGTRFDVDAAAEGDRLHVRGSGGDLRLPADTLPTSYWHVGMLTRARLLDTQRGVVSDMAVSPPAEETIEVAGRPVRATRYGISGDLVADLWYLPNGEWAKLRFRARGAEIAYVRRTPADLAVLPSAALRAAMPPAFGHN